MLYLASVMAAYNKSKLYATLGNDLDVSKNYTQKEILEMQTSKNSKQFVEPTSQKANVIGEFVEHQGEILTDSVDASKKRPGRPKKNVELDS